MATKTTKQTEDKYIKEIKAYKNYKGKIEIDIDTVLITLWNNYIENEYGSKIAYNGKTFFENNFNNAYDAAWSVTLSGKWRWSDTFVYFDEEGYIVSFSHWNDENSPIDIDKIDINHLIDGLARGQKNKKRYVDNIPRAIHDALKEV